MSYSKLQRNYTHFGGFQRWHIGTTKYRLHDYCDEEIHAIVADCCSVISNITGKPPIAFRAGGWCSQPFERIAEALSNNGIWIDSSMFKNGVSNDPARWFNFTNAPDKPYWYFNSNPEIEEQNGRFLGVPISSYPLSPLFFWKMVFMKKLFKGKHKSLGDGYPMTANTDYYLQRLTQTTYGPVSVDGAKAGTLNAAFQDFKRRFPSGIFNIMGHPKALSEYSLRKLDQFLATAKDITSITFQDLEAMKSQSTNSL